ncbi:non-heme iron oxygenase ferredoxin subunit [Microbacterium sp. ZW T5_56]|uniref:non-heme iron oxygenase ferredoxin subunit n=1 Tax=Microbacterium sp. ZW T5_56 TaxID=3378081 RepID=UPI0038541C1C
MTASRACSVSELEQDSALRVVIEDVAICIVKDADDVIHAIGDTCTHGDISLADGFVEGETIECWAHGSAFSLTSGKPLTLPAFEPVPVFDVVIDGDDVLIDPNVKKEIN